MVGSVLSGRKGLFIWNWSSLGSDPEGRIRPLLEETGVSAVLLKAWDGDHWFNQGPSWKECAGVLRSAGVEVVGAWGYQLLEKPAVEAKLAAECVSYGGADLVVLNCEDPTIEQMEHPDEKATRFFNAYRGWQPDTETWFCSHAQPVYHQRQPYWQALQAGCGMMPMAYHGAMEMDPARAVTVTQAEYEQFQLTGNGMCFAGDAYAPASAGVTGDSLAAWAAAAIAEESEGMVWWSLDDLLMRPDLRAAIGQVAVPKCP